jgi:hypothetical protein
MLHEEFIRKDNEFVQKARKIAKDARPGIIWRLKMFVRRMRENHG